MTVYVIGHTKGGTGKTTLSVQAALTMAERGLNPWFVDGDVQQTGMKAMKSREEIGRREAIPASGYPDQADMRSQIRVQKRNFDHVVIDCGAGDTRTLRAALLTADVLVTPLLVGIFELWALDDMEQVVHEVNASREIPLVCRAVLNCADPKAGSPDNITCRTYAADSELFGAVLDTAIVRRKAIGYATASGLTAAEYSPHNPLAAAEVSRFVDELLTIKP